MSLIQALRGASPAQAPAQGPGVSFLGEGVQGVSLLPNEPQDFNSGYVSPIAAALARVPSGMSNQVEPIKQKALALNPQYAASEQFDPVNPFGAGQALNDAYKNLFQQDAGIDLPDMRQFGGRYAAELASETGRKGLGRNIGQAQAELANNGLYKAGDMDMLAGLNFNDPWTQANYANLFKSGNSYFIPDKVEADPYIYALHSPMAQTQTKEQQDQLFNQMYGGQTMVNKAQGVQGWGRGDFGPEAVMRGLLDYKSVEGSTAPRASYSNPYTDARDVLTGMDVGRGALTQDQAWNLSRAIEYKNYLKNRPDDPDYQRAFSDYMKVVDTIDPSADLSSAELIRILRGG